MGCVIWNSLIRRTRGDVQDNFLPVIEIGPKPPTRLRRVCCIRCHDLHGSSENPLGIFLNFSTTTSANRAIYLCRSGRGDVSEWLRATVDLYSAEANVLIVNGSWKIQNHKSYLVHETGDRLPSSGPVARRSQKVPFHDIKIVRATSVPGNRLQSLKRFRFSVFGAQN